MLLDEFVAQVIEEPTATTRSKITLSNALTASLYHLGNTSEAQVRQWAMPLKLNPRTGQLVTGGPWRGARAAVDWPERVVFDPELIGTAHTHPYAKRLSPDAQVGFSIGDLSFYTRVHEGRPITVHFVACSRTLFLAIYRHVTRTTLTHREWQDMETDERACARLVKASIGPDPVRAEAALDEMLGEVTGADRAGRIDEAAETERAFFERIPGYVALRSKANHDMIRDAARSMRFDLYWGRLGGSLHLQSNRTHGSSGLKGIWQQVFG